MPTRRALSAHRAAAYRGPVPADDQPVQPTSTSPSTARAVPTAPDPERVRAKLTLALGDDAIDIWADACRAVGVEIDDVTDVDTLIAVRGTHRTRWRREHRRTQSADQVPHHDTAARRATGAAMTDRVTSTPASPTNTTTRRAVLNDNDRLTALSELSGRRDRRRAHQAGARCRPPAAHADRAVQPGPR